MQLLGVNSAKCSAHQRGPPPRSPLSRLPGQNGAAQAQGRRPVKERADRHRRRGGRRWPAADWWRRGPHHQPAPPHVGRAPRPHGVSARSCRGDARARQRGASPGDPWRWCAAHAASCGSLPCPSRPNDTALLTHDHCVLLLTVPIMLGKPPASRGAAPHAAPSCSTPPHTGAPPRCRRGCQTPCARPCSLTWPHPHVRQAEPAAAHPLDAQRQPELPRCSTQHRTACPPAGARKPAAVRSRSALRPSGPLPRPPRPEPCRQTAQLCTRNGVPHRPHRCLAACRLPHRAPSGVQACVAHSQLPLLH